MQGCSGNRELRFESSVLFFPCLFKSNKRISEKNCVISILLTCFQSKFHSMSNGILYSLMPLRIFPLDSIDQFQIVLCVIVTIDKFLPFSPKTYP